MTTDAPTTIDPDIEDDDFRTGGMQAAEDDKADRARRGSRFGRAEYLSSLLKTVGDSVTLRFLTDENGWIEVKEHGWIETKKQRPVGMPAEMRWPEHVGAVCRFSLKRDKTTFYPDCYICQHKKDDKGRKPWQQLKMWALAVVRIPIIGTKEMFAAGAIPEFKIGQPVSYTDEMIDVEELGPPDSDGKRQPTGNTTKKRRIIIVNMALANFFTHLNVYAKHHGTVLDRDFYIERDEVSSKVVYNILAREPIQRQLKNEAGAVIGVEVYDLRDPKYMTPYLDQIKEINLRGIVRARMSDEYYARYFDETKTSVWDSSGDADSDSEGTGTGTGTSTGKTAPPVTTAPPSASQEEIQAKLAGFAARMMQDNPVPAASGEAATVEPDLSAFLTT